MKLASDHDARRRADGPAVGAAPDRRRTRSLLRKARVLLPLLILAPACAEPPSTLERIRERGFIRAAYSQEPPYAFRAEDDVVRGESPAALREAVTEIGVGSIRWSRLDFPDLVPALLEGRVDVVAAGMFITPARTRRVRFSAPTVCAGPALVVREEAPWRSLPDLVASARGRVAVLDGSIEEEGALAMGVAEDRLLRVSDLTTALAAVEHRVADAFAISAPTARFALARGDRAGLVVAAYGSPPGLPRRLDGCSGLVFRPDDEDLVRAADRALSGWVGSEEHLGTIVPLGFRASDLPEPDERP